jgi:hypothetical protein
MDWGLGRTKDGRPAPQFGQSCPLGTLDQGTEGALGQGCPFLGQFLPNPLQIFFVGIKIRSNTLLC